MYAALLAKKFNKSNAVTRPGNELTSALSDTAAANNEAAEPSGSAPKDCLQTQQISETASKPVTTQADQAGQPATSGLFGLTGSKVVGPSGSGIKTDGREEFTSKGLDNSKSANKNVSAEPTSNSTTKVYKF